MTDQDPLRHLRAELDRLDETLLDTLRRRIDCGVRIAEYKVRHDLPMMQAGSGWSRREQPGTPPRTAWTPASW